MSSAASPLLVRHLDLLESASHRAPILDLACGNGRNGLYLIKHNIPVVFADVDMLALEAVEDSLSTSDYRQHKPLATLWSVDLEQPCSHPLQDRHFGGVIVFRYLHRALIQSIRQALLPGGIIIYETFTVDQPRYGRPNSPAFLLGHGELQEIFSDWDILHQFEGVIRKENNGGPQAISQIVAAKPFETGLTQ